MSREIVAFRIASRVLRIASLAESIHTLMSEECEKYKIPVKVETNWFGLAISAASRSGVHGADVEEVATEAVHNVLFGKKTEEQKSYSEAYVFSNILPAIVARFKNQGWSVEDIKKDHKTLAFIEKSKISKEKAERKIEEFYKTDKKPKLNSFTGKPVDQDLLGKRKLIEKNFFDSYDPKRSAHFEAYFYEAVKNEASHIVEARDKMLQESLSIQPESRTHVGDDYVPGTIQENKLRSTETKAEHKILLKDLLGRLKKIDPLYSKALEMMNHGWDIASNEFSKCVGMDVPTFLKWRNGFLKALHSVAQKGDVTSDDLLHAIKYGKLEGATSDKIEFHPDLGVHKTYKGFKWQPGYNEVSFVRPGAKEFEVFWGTRDEFFSAVDKGKL